MNDLTPSFERETGQVTLEGLPAGAAGKNHHHPGGGNRNFPAEIFFNQGQSEIDPRGDPARRVDIPVAVEEEAGINLNRGVFRREDI